MLRHRKVVFAATIIYRENGNVGKIIVEEMLLIAKREQTSHPFLVLITQLCEDGRVPFVEKTDVRITSASSSDIQRIRGYYLWDDAALKKPHQ